MIFVIFFYNVIFQCFTDFNGIVVDVDESSLPSFEQIRLGGINDKLWKRKNPIIRQELKQITILVHLEKHQNDFSFF